MFELDIIIGMVRIVSVVNVSEANGLAVLANFFGR